MNTNNDIRLLWVSFIGSAAFALPSAVLFCLELYFYFSKNWFVFWHRNTINPIGLGFMAIIWLSFPVIYVLVLRRKACFDKKKLLAASGISNALSIIMPLLMVLLLFALEIKDIS